MCDIICLWVVINQIIDINFYYNITLSLCVNIEKKLFLSKCITENIKNLSNDICNKNNVLIKYMETNKDHIHYMIETTPNISISKIVKFIKSYTTYHVWKNNYSLLKKYYWKEKTFWADGYFVSSIGNVSEKTLKEYIENQG